MEENGCKNNDKVPFKKTGTTKTKTGPNTGAICFMTSCFVTISFEKSKLPSNELMLKF